jgi:hypothetical protein
LLFPPPPPPPPLHLWSAFRSLKSKNHCSRLSIRLPTFWEAPSMFHSWEFVGITIHVGYCWSWKYVCSPKKIERCYFTFGTLIWGYWVAKSAIVCSMFLQEQILIKQNQLSIFRLRQALCFYTMFGTADNTKFLLWLLLLNTSSSSSCFGSDLDIICLKTLK